MADVFSIEKRSEVMSKIRAKNTKPEVIVRKFLFSQGFRFHIHKADLPGKPDIVLKKYKTIILINGCFWHGHKNCKIFKLPKTNQEYWTSKIEKNAFNLFLNKKKLRLLGWRVIEVWECQLTISKRPKTFRKIVQKIFA